VTEEPKPVGSGRFRVPSQDSSRVLGRSFSSSLSLSEEGCVAQTHGEYDGQEVALLAQLRLPRETSSKRIPPDKSILFPAPHSPPFSPVGGTDVQGASKGGQNLRQTTSGRALATLPPRVSRARGHRRTYSSLRRDDGLRRYAYHGMAELKRWLGWGIIASHLKHLAQAKATRSRQKQAT
jgi:hypothetical protein